MCGITGVFDTYPRGIDQRTLSAMAEAIAHRGPDDQSFYRDERCGFGFQRLSIIDVKYGKQPFISDNGNVVLICNGEIFNYKELRQDLVLKGYTFKTNCDVEVILHAYLEYGTSFISRLSGQFAFALLDKKENKIILARDHFGICPLFYTHHDGRLIFGSEIKAILKYPHLKREVNLTGLDQMLTLPGIVSPVTMFKGINSVKPGHFIVFRDDAFTEQEYWDLSYPVAGAEGMAHHEDYYMEQLEDLLLKSISTRLNADVPLGYYLSGGLDSSLIAGMISKLTPGKNYPSFSIVFPGSEEKEIDESFYQRLIAKQVNAKHHEVEFRPFDIYNQLKQVIYAAESPLKETYNTCSLSLSARVKQENVKVVLSGEGADELFGGYIGYQLDGVKNRTGSTESMEDLMEDQLRAQMWGDAGFFYEKKYYEFGEQKRALYAEGLNSRFADFDCCFNLGIDKSKIVGIDDFHKRSYLDLKLRLADHLIADHCDRVSYMNSIEGRYPFLDVDLVEFLAGVPVSLKLKGMTEKYILKKIAGKYIPAEIINRQKFSFVAPGSPAILQDNVEWVNDFLSFDMIKRQGYFNPETVERLKKMYTRKGFKLNLPFDSDFLITVLTFNIFLSAFDMPDFSG